MNAIELSGVNFSYNGSPVLERVSLTVPEGDFLAVLGPNGGGKTTLLKIMLGLLSPQSGQARILGRPAGQAGGLIGYLPQHTHVGRSFPITVLDAVTLGLVRPGFLGVRGLLPSKGDREQARAALARVNMLDQADRLLSDLSGGQKQRVFIARALAASPRLLLLDEPTASVDPLNRNSLFQLLGELNRDMTIVLVSHDVSVLARGVRSVACVNRTLHQHPAPVLTQEMFQMAYGGDEAACCPVELVTHGGVPHRVLADHPENEVSVGSAKNVDHG